MPLADTGPALPLPLLSLSFFHVLACVSAHILSRIHLLLTLAGSLLVQPQLLPLVTALGSRLASLPPGLSLQTGLHSAPWGIPLAHDPISHSLTSDLVLTLRLHSVGGWQSRALQPPQNLTSPGALTSPNFPPPSLCFCCSGLPDPQSQQAPPAFEAVHRLFPVPGMLFPDIVSGLNSSPQTSSEGHPI